MFVIGSLCVFAAGAQAQGKVAVEWKCAKPAVVHTLDTGDQPGHTYGISQFKCAATKGQIEGVAQKEGAGTEFAEGMGNNVKMHGVFVETLASVDRIHYTYEGAATVRGNQMVTGTDKWTVVNGTGKFKGAKGEGTCKGKGSADGSSNWVCEGTIQLAGGAAAKAPAKK